MARRKKGDDINGWLIVDKPRDMTSNAVVGVVRRLYGANKCGHAGTLDPFATGVLPIAFGEATKLISYVTDGEKEYEFVLQFGVSTTTDDSEGEVVVRGTYNVYREDIEKVLPEFLGKIRQVPSKFSAIKINGERAYNLARKGETVEIPEREIEIYALELLEMLEGNAARLRVRCSKGTYVRTLGKDIASKIGTVGHLKELRRTKCGVFSLDDTILLEKLKKMVYKEELLGALFPITTYLRDIAVIAVSEADAKKLKLGQSVSPKNYDIHSLVGRELIAMDGESLVAIVEVDERRIRPLRVFNI